LNFEVFAVFSFFNFKVDSGFYFF